MISYTGPEPIGNKVKFNPTVHKIGDPCSKGHNGIRYIAAPNLCVQCQRDSIFIYKSRNKDSINTYNEEYNKAHKEERQIYKRDYDTKNKTLRSESGKEYYSKNRVKILEQRKTKRAAETDGEKVVRIESRRVYHNAYNKEKRANDPEFALKCILQCRLWDALTQQSVKKSLRTFELTGCAYGYLKTHIESLFQPGMNWSNRGEWHIDHIRPCRSFDLSDPIQQKECFHYSNLQPLWGAENTAKGSKWNGKDWKYEEAA